MKGTTQFTIYEAHVALYPSNEDDEVTGDAVWLGCCFERADLSRSYTQRLRPFHGRTRQTAYNEDESHTIELATPLQVGAGNEIKSLERFGRYILVIVWHDEERMVWLKRTYYGVTDASEQVGGEVVVGMQSALRAERMVATPGRDEWPALNPENQFGAVYYVRGESRLQLYGYGLEDVFFEMPGFDAAKGQIVPASGTLSIYVEGELAMLVTDEEVRVNEIVALGGSYFDSPDAKLEFMSNGIRVATLGKDGTLAVADVAESDTAPGGAADIELRVNGTLWVASFAVGLATAKEFSEFLTP